MELCRIPSSRLVRPKAQDEGHMRARPDTKNSSTIGACAGPCHGQYETQVRPRTKEPRTKEPKTKEP
eukprot:scaffold6532_cov116-Isochrysis_galbana.AAC.13